MSCRAKQFSFAALLALVSALTCGAYDGAANFNDRVSLTIKGQGSAMSNFPLLVRLSSTQLPGFSYDRANIDELAFVDSDGTTALSYDVDTWNTSGESLVWVKLPELPTGGKTITMYWSLKSGGSAPPNNPSDVWSEYAGVWHFSESIAGDVAASTYSSDSSGHGLWAIPTLGSAGGSLAEMVSVRGAIGNARVNGSSSAVDKSGGNHLVVSNHTALALGSTFTFSGWVDFDNYSDVPRIISKFGGGNGWEVTLGNSANRDKISVTAQGQTTTRKVFGGNAKDADGYTLITVVYNNGKVSVFGNGGAEYGYSDVDLATVVDTANNLTFGCSSDGTGRSMWGSYDEFRLRKTAVSSAQVAAEYANVTQGGYLDAVKGVSFVTPDPVVTDGSVVNDY